METSSTKFKIVVGVLGALTLVGVAAWIYQLACGLGVTGMSNGTSWGLYISMFMFFVGLSAGGLIVASSASVFHVKEYKKVALPAVILSTVCICCAGMFVLIDLGGIQRVWRIVTGPNPTSPLFWDICIITLYLVVNIIYLALMTSKKPDAEHKVAIVSRFALPVAILVHSVTAWIFGLEMAKEGWYSAIMAPLFVVSAMDSGLALLILVAFGLGQGQGIQSGEETRLQPGRAAGNLCGHRWLFGWLRGADDGVSRCRRRRDAGHHGNGCHGAVFLVRDRCGRAGSVLHPGVRAESRAHGAGGAGERFGGGGRAVQALMAASHLVRPFQRGWRSRRHVRLHGGARRHGHGYVGGCQLVCAHLGGVRGRCRRGVAGRARVRGAVPQAAGGAYAGPFADFGGSRVLLACPPFSWPRGIFPPCRGAAIRAAFCALRAAALLETIRLARKGCVMATAVSWETLSEAYAFVGNSLLKPMTQTADAGLDPAFWEAFPTFGDEGVASSAAVLAAHARAVAKTAEEGKDPVLSCAVEYTRLFVGPPSPAAPPWETFYRGCAGAAGAQALSEGAGGASDAAGASSVRREVTVGFGQATFDMRRLLREAGLEVRNENNQYEDHLGIELLYLSTLCARAAALDGAEEGSCAEGADALRAKDAGARAEDAAMHMGDAAAPRAEDAVPSPAIASFIEVHPLAWLPSLRAAVEKAAPGGYFSRLLALADALLRVPLNASA